jgi:hypothetical protein
LSLLLTVILKIDRSNIITSQTPSAIFHVNVTVNAQQIRKMMPDVIRNDIPRIASNVNTAITPTPIPVTNSLIFTSFLAAFKTPPVDILLRLLS